MSAAIRASITETFGFEPILINSALVSAQNRQRLYWCGIRQADGTYKKADIQQPADRGILLKDIIETNAVTWLEKSYTIDATYSKGGLHNGEKPHQSSKRLMAAEPVAIRDDGKAHVLTAHYDSAVIWNSLERQQKTMVAEPVCVAQRGRYDESEKVYQHYEAQPTRKTNNLTTVSKDNLIAEPIKLGEIGKGGQGNRVYSIDAPIYEVKDGYITVKGKKYPIKLVDGFYIIRKLTVRECMRLQTVPEWYEWPVSKSQAYKMLGNGWTVEVIAHLLRGLK